MSAGMRGRIPQPEGSSRVGMSPRHSASGGASVCPSPGTCVIPGCEGWRLPPGKGGLQSRSIGACAQGGGCGLSDFARPGQTAAPLRPVPAPSWKPPRPCHACRSLHCPLCQGPDRALAHVSRAAAPLRQSPDRGWQVRGRGRQSWGRTRGTGSGPPGRGLLRSSRRSWTGVSFHWSGQTGLPGTPDEGCAGGKGVSHPGDRPLVGRSEAPCPWSVIEHGGECGQVCRPRALPVRPARRSPPSREDVGLMPPHLPVCLFS